jgi:hypothetical protein
MGNTKRTRAGHLYLVPFDRLHFLYRKAMHPLLRCRAPMRRDAVAAIATDTSTDITWPSRMEIPAREEDLHLRRGCLFTDSIQRWERSLWKETTSLHSGQMSARYPLPFSTTNSAAKARACS